LFVRKTARGILWLVRCFSFNFFFLLDWATKIWSFPELWSACAETCCTSVSHRVCCKAVVMILSRRLECFYYLLTLTANILGETSYTTVGHHARGVLKYWRRTAEEQRARLFDLLPKNVESSYTPVHYSISNLPKKKFRSNRACSVLISVGISLLYTAGSNQAPRVPCWGSSRDNRRRVGLIYIHFILSDWKENCPLILDVVILNRLCTVRCSTGTFWNFTEYHLNRPVGLLIGKSCFLCMGSWNLPVLGSSIHLVVPSVIIYII
jgi:hypothetical protein